MELIEFSLDNVPHIKDVALCLGFFDGIHLGHKAIINKAKESGKKTAVLSFYTPPSYVIGRKDTLRSLTSVDDKADILEQMGVDYLLIMPFDLGIKNMTKDDFINDVLKQIEPSELFCGEDYRFGKEALGTPGYLKKYFKITIVPLLNIDGHKFSSRAIRQAIYDGRIKEANKYLGHYYRIGGLIKEGNHIGTSLGFPTANMDLDFPYCIPNNGVYIGYAHVLDNKYKCLISVGTHPTLKELDAALIEVYILDFNQIIYGDFLFIEFVDRIRDMIKFDSTEELIKQIRLDKKEAEKRLE